MNFGEKTAELRRLILKRTGVKVKFELLNVALGYEKFIDESKGCTRDKFKIIGSSFILHHVNHYLFVNSPSDTPGQLTLKTDYLTGSIHLADCMMSHNFHQYILEYHNIGIARIMKHYGNSLRAIVGMIDLFHGERYCKRFVDTLFQDAYMRLSENEQVKEFSPCLCLSELCGRNSLKFKYGSNDDGTEARIFIQG